MKSLAWVTNRISSPRQGAALVALLSTVSKEALYQATVRVGQKQQSPALIANAWHHRSDGVCLFR